MIIWPENMDFAYFADLCYNQGIEVNMLEENSHITASEFQKSFGAVSDAALRKPIIITKQGRDHLVVLAADEYKRLKRRDRIVHATGELPDEWLEAIRTSEMDSRHEHLNSLLND